MRSDARKRAAEHAHGTDTGGEVERTFPLVDGEPMSDIGRMYYRREHMTPPPAQPPPTLSSPKPADSAAATTPAHTTKPPPNTPNGWRSRGTWRGP